MKPLFTLLLLALFSLRIFAQQTDNRGWYDRKEIEKIDIGWIKIVQFNTPAKPFAQNGWNYPSSQTDAAQKVAVWMQKSYTPKGLLGEIVPSIYAPERPETASSSSYTYDEAEKNNRNALPNTYGAFAKLYMNLGKTATKKFWPISGLADYYVWNIMANNLELISKQLVALSSPDEYYFILPKYTAGIKGEFDGEGYKDYANIKISPTVQT